MQTLSRLAEAVLAELAADQGIRPLAPDAENIIPVEIGDITLAMSFSAASESAFLISIVAAAPVDRAGWPWLVFALASRMTARRTRLAIEPETGQLAVIAQIAMTGLRQGQFIGALEGFLEDVRSVREGIADHPASNQSKDPAWEADFIIRP